MLSEPWSQLVKRKILLHAQIRHKNVIPLLGIWRGPEGGPPLMVMPFAENGSALAYLQEDNRDASHCAKIVSSSVSCRNSALEVLNSSWLEVHLAYHTYNLDYL